MTSLLSATVALCLLPAVSSAPVIVAFAEYATAAVPAAYGHVTFLIDRAALVLKFSGHAKQVLEHYETVVFPEGPPCSGLECLHFASADSDSSSRRAQYADLVALRITIDRTTSMMCELVFGEERSREKRQLGPVSLFAGVAAVCISLRNSYEMERFRRQLADERSRTDHLIHLAHDVVSYQLRDHAMLLRLVNATAAFQRAVKASRSMQAYLAHKIALESIEAECRETYSALSLLHKGIVAPILVDQSALRRAYSEVSARYTCARSALTSCISPACSSRPWPGGRA